MKRLDQLNILRFIAAVTIVVFHYGDYTFPFTAEPLVRIAKGEPYIFSFFIVLSGFVLTYVYASHIDRGLHWTKFIVNRLSRFYPLYLATLLIIAPFKFGKAPNDLIGLGLSAIMLQSWIPPYPPAFNLPAWMMSDIFALYLIFPAVLPWLYKKSVRGAAILTAGVWAFTQIFVHLVLNYENIEQYIDSDQVLQGIPIFHLSTFLTGIFFGLLYLKIQGREKVGQKWNLMIIGVLVAGLVAFAFLRTDLQKATSFELMYADGLLAPVYGWLLLSLARDRSWLASFMSRPGLIKLGDLSFSIYLLQDPLNTLYKRYLQGPLENFLPYSWTSHLHFYLFFGILLVIAWLSRKCFEDPLQRRIRKIYDRNRSRSGA